MVAGIESVCSPSQAIDLRQLTFKLDILNQKPMNEYLLCVDSRNYLLERLQKAKGRLLCTDEEFSYFRVYMYGTFLLYRRKTLRPDGRKAYFLTDLFAKCLGFRSLHEMKFVLFGIQYWRGFISVQRLKIAFDHYNGIR